MRDAAPAKKPAKPALNRDTPPTSGDGVDDDDILAPVRSPAERGPTAVPMKERATKIGLLPLVPVGDAGKPLADSLTAELLKALNESAVAEVKALGLDAGNAAGGSVNVARATAAKKAGDESLARGRQLLTKLQFGKAKKILEAALASYDNAAPLLESPQPLVDAWLALAEVAARQAQDDEVHRCFAAVVALNPELELDKKRFPGLFLTTHRKVRDQLLKGQRASILVDETGTGATVFVDGRPAKTAPARIGGLFPGPHLVRAAREGLPAWGAVVVVEPGATATASPGFLAKGTRGPGEDLAQNKLSAEAAGVVAEAARKQGLKAGVVGVVSKDAGRAVVQLVYVDAASGKVAQLPTATFSPSLLDAGIEALKARARMDELVGLDKPSLADADDSEALIEDARAGAAVTVAAVEFKYNVKISKDAPAARKVAADDEVERDDGDDEGGERVVAEARSGSRRSIDGDEEVDGGRRSDGSVDEDAPLTAQPWFVPTMIVVGVAGSVGVLAGTGAALVGAGVLPDPRPADGAALRITLPASP
ncbi:MAG: hypothetical protein FJ137_03100 [Deltaproteobacteria bacterium]|nr:hypothetical protein [Deltaproteobacteria bacterium]